MEMSARKPLFPRRVLDLPIDALRPNPNQPRIEFDEASLSWPRASAATAFSSR